jgi:hypothetical protein
MDRYLGIEGVVTKKSFWIALDWRRLAWIPVSHENQTTPGFHPRECTETAFGWCRIGEKPAPPKPIQGRKKYPHPRPGIGAASSRDSCESLRRRLRRRHSSRPRLHRQVCQRGSNHRLRLIQVRGLRLLLGLILTSIPFSSPLSLVRVCVHRGGGGRVLPDGIEGDGGSFRSWGADLPLSIPFLLSRFSYLMTMDGYLNLLVWHCVSRICAAVLSKIRICSTPSQLGHFLFQVRFGLPHSPLLHSLLLCFIDLDPSLI